MNYATNTLKEISKTQSWAQNIDAFEQLKTTELFEDWETMLTELSTLWAGLDDVAAIYDVLPDYQTFEAGDSQLDAHQWGCAMALAWWSMPADGVVGETGHVTIDGDLDLTERMVVNGNLTIQGDLAQDSFVFYEQDGQTTTNKPELIVFGDLIIEGDWRFDGSVVLVMGDIIVKGSVCEQSEWSLIVTGGQLRAQGAIINAGELFVGGHLRAPFVHLSYNHGQTIVCECIESTICIVDDHGHSWSARAPEGPFVYAQEMLIGAGEEIPFEFQASYDALLAHLTDGAIEALVLEDEFDEDDIFFDEIASDLFAYVEEHGVSATIKTAS